MSTPTKPPPGVAGPAEYMTPTKRVAYEAAGPSRRPQAASPAYSSRKHSLYGIEDRIVIDPGSRVWKVGFSGEPDPRSVFWVSPARYSQKGKGKARESTEAWDLDLEDVFPDRPEAGRIVGVRVLEECREVFHKHLLTDPKSRKVIILENTFLPAYVKDHIAQALFDNLKVPSVSFTPSSVLALAACGRITGLVVDIGWLETTVTPVYHSRPLFHLARATPLAGRAFHRRLRALLRHHTTYHPPAGSPALADQVPLDVLTDELVERVITESCLASPALSSPWVESHRPETNLASGEQVQDEVDLMNRLKARYQPDTRAKDTRFSIPSPPASRLGPGILVVPGWGRERAVEVLFGEHEGEETSLLDLILRCLLSLPIDLRKPLISSILVVGGTASLPGLIPRIRQSLLACLSPPTGSPAPTAPQARITPEGRAAENALWRSRSSEPYSALYPLASKIAILNDPAPLDVPGEPYNRGGNAPRWTPALMSWVGGSLAGVLKTGGQEILREDYDTLVSENYARGQAWTENLRSATEEIATLAGVALEELEPGMALVGDSNRKRQWDGSGIIGDWARGVAPVEV